MICKDLDEVASIVLMSAALGQYPGWEIVETRKDEAFGALIKILWQNYQQSVHIHSAPRYHMEWAAKLLQHFHGNEVVTILYTIMLCWICDVTVR